MNKKFISWRRVSTFRQSKSGLGLEAQKEIIKYFIERDKGEWVADYEECYTGTELSGCVELRKAMNHAKSIGATLIIAKTDRFRNTAEALKIYEEMGEGHIMFCDLPTSDKFSLTLFFALAEREALIVSIRTKQALAVKKTQGAKLGASNEKYKERFAMKSKEQKKIETQKRANTKRMNNWNSRDTQTFVKVIQRVFPDACCSQSSRDWQWGEINTRGNNKTLMLQLMKDYHDIDHDIFASWNFDDDKIKLQVKLAGLIRETRNNAQYINS